MNYHHEVFYLPLTFLRLLFVIFCSTCRERCGGQGYLSCNRFGSLIGFSHAGITAEGDNRVLFQKAAKELMASAHVPAVKVRAQAADAPPTVTAAK